jgi:hypothetical protein
MNDDTMMIAMIAGMLMAGGKFTTVEYALRTARELVAGAKAGL